MRRYINGQASLKSATRCPSSDEDDVEWRWNVASSNEARHRVGRSARVVGVVLNGLRDYDR